MAIIKQFLSYLILLLCIFMHFSLAMNDTNYIRCTSRCSTLQLSFSNPTTLSCSDNNDDTTIYDYAVMCGIEYRIDFNTEQIFVDFHATNTTSSPEDQPSKEFLIQTIRLSLLENTYHPNDVVRKYACSTNDDCARRFYLDKINSLINDDKSQLDLIRIKLHNDSLLTGEKAQRRCIDSNKISDKKSRKCAYGICYARVEIFELDKRQNTKRQSCETSKTPSLFSEFEHHVPKSTQKERQVLEYSCNKNVCNRNDMIPKIQTIIYEYTNWDPVRPQPKAGNFSVKQAMSSNILVLLLTLIQLFI